MRWKPTCALVRAMRSTKCAAGSTSPAPDVRGTWGITYDDTIGVEVKIGGAVYNAELGAAGGSFTIDHEGTPYTFDLDCSRPEIVCPSEAWPYRVVVDQRDVQHQHQMVVNLPQATCSGPLSEPEPGTCGAVRFELRGWVNGEPKIVIEHVNRMGHDAAPE